MNKPSKKTEWEKEYKRRYNDFFGSAYWYDSVKDFIRNLLHQRDNEIREKIQGMKKPICGCEDGQPRIDFVCRKCGGRYDSGVQIPKNALLDDLLTYLSNREV